MTNRKRWTGAEEAQLKLLLEANTKIEDIAAKLQKTPGAIVVKCQRLGLQLPVGGYLISAIPLPRDLPSVEEAGRMLAGAMKASVKTGLNRLEVQRLMAVDSITKIYKELIVDYAGYRELERKFEKMEKDNAQMRAAIKKMEAKSPKVSPTAVTGEVA